MLFDPFRFARNGELLEKVVSLTPEGRLEGVIADKSDLSLQMKGYKTEQHRYVLEGSLQGFVVVQCQVCLENFQMPVAIEFRLYLVKSEKQADDLQQEFEPLIIEDDSLALIDLVNNELILSMPVAISHIEVEGKDCINKDLFSSGNLDKEIQEEKKSSPFAVLKLLNSIKQKDS